MAVGRGTLNKVLLIGRLGADPELRYAPNGAAVVNFNVATNMVWRDQDGNQQERTDWHRVVAWRRLAETASEYLKKGRRVYVEGRLQTRSYEDQNGVRRWVTEIVAEQIQFLDARGETVAEEEVPPPPPERFRSGAIAPRGPSPPSRRDPCRPQGHDRPERRIYPPPRAACIQACRVPPSANPMRSTCLRISVNCCRPVRPGTASCAPAFRRPVSSRST